MSESINDNHEKSRSKYLKKRYIITILLAAILIIALLGCLIFYLNKNFNNISNDDKSNAKTEKIDESISEEQRLIDQAEKEAAIKSYDSELVATGDSSQKVQILLSKAAIYFNDQDFKTALETTQQAAAIKETIGVADFLGQIYVKLNDNSSAIKYYQKCLSLSDKESPTYASDINYYDNLIKQLIAEG